MPVPSSVWVDRCPSRRLAVCVSTVRRRADRRIAGTEARGELAPCASAIAPCQSDLALKSSVVLTCGVENFPSKHCPFPVWSCALSGSTRVGPSGGRGMFSPLPLSVSLALPAPPVRIVIVSRSSGSPSLSLYLNPFGGRRPIWLQHGREPRV